MSFKMTSEPVFVETDESKLSEDVPKCEALKDTKALTEWNHYAAFLTYNSAHLPKEKLAAHLLKLCEGHTETEIMIAHEIGDEKQREHTHVYMRSSQSWRMRSKIHEPTGRTGNFFWPFWFLHEGKWYLPNVKRPKKGRTKARCIESKKCIPYLEKQDPEPYSTFKREEYFPKETLLEAFDNGNVARLEREVSSLHDLEAFLRMRERVLALKQVIPINMFRKLTVMDATLLSVLASPAIDCRSAWWLWSMMGNVGKTELSRFLEKADPFHVGYFALAKNADFQLLLLNAIKGGCDLRMVIIDLTKSESTWLTEHGSSIYSIIENVKKGFIQSTKYNSCKVELTVDHPHVVVFANAAPDRNALSADRWKVHQIDAPGSEMLEPVEDDWLEEYLQCSYYQNDCASIQNLRNSLRLPPRWKTDSLVRVNDVPPIRVRRQNIGF